MRRDRSIPADYFEALYREKGDPWSFETSPYEAAKYAETIKALPHDICADALEIGCANGVLTQKLGPFCKRLLAIDVSPTALSAAASRCREQSHIRFEKRQLPAEAPDGSFDLIILSEVVYYWDDADLALMAKYILTALISGGYLLLVHWIGETDYPKSGDDAVGSLRAMLGNSMLEHRSDRQTHYRLDLWQRG